MDFVDFIVQLVVHLSDSAQLEVTLLTQVFKVVHDESQFTLLLHAAVDLSGHLLLVILFLAVNAIPSFILYPSASLFKLRDHLLNLPSQLVLLLLKGIMFQLLLLF